MKGFMVSDENDAIREERAFNAQYRRIANDEM